MSENIFKFKNYFFSTGTPNTKKLDGILVIHFSGLQEQALELQANSMMVYLECIFRTSTTFLAKQHPKFFY